MSPLRRLTTTLVLLGLGTGCGAPPEVPTSIIFFIADGAGTAHWTLAHFAEPDLAVHDFTTVGLVDTRGAGHTVSGSAPTATAYAIGQRSFMGAVGVAADSTPVQSVLELALARGMGTGLVTTTWLADATPAAFGAHQVSRGALAEIAGEMTSKGIDVLMGGGRRAFPPGVRGDYTYVESIEALRALDQDTVTGLLGLFAEEDMGVVADRGDALQHMTTAALRILGRAPNGFFLMVENEESDTQSHRNSGQDTITTEMLDFDRAVRLGLEYQAENPGTLILVTGDHETGGIGLNYDPDDPRREVVMQYTTQGHTGALLPLFARGPGAERFGGIIENRRVGQLLLELVGGMGR